MRLNTIGLMSALAEHVHPTKLPDEYSEQLRRAHVLGKLSELRAIMGPCAGPDSPALIVAVLEQLADFDPIAALLFDVLRQHLPREEALQLLALLLEH